MIFRDNCFNILYVTNIFLKEVEAMKLQELSQLIMDYANENFMKSTIPGFKTILKSFLDTADELSIDYACQELYDTLISKYHESRNKKNLCIWVCRIADRIAGTHALRDPETFFNALPLPAETEVESLFKGITYPIKEIDLKVLTVRCVTVIKAFRLSDSSVGQYLKVWKAITCCSYQTGTTLYSRLFVENFLKHKESALNNGTIRKWQMKMVRRAVAIMIQVADTGTYKWEYIYKKPGIDNPEFKPLFKEYVEYCINSDLADNTVKTHSHVFRRFLNNSGITGMAALKNISPDDIKKILTYYSLRYSSRSMQTVEPIIAQILDFLYESNYVPNKLSGMVLKTCCVKDNVAAYISKDDTELLIDTLDNFTKRDKAIVLTLLCLGLRGSDICNLKFENIDWKSEKIHLIQVKTNTPITLPLVAQVGNAIYDYIKEERPSAAIGNPYIFVSGRAPYQNLHSLYGVCSRILKTLNIKTVNASSYGPHVFRYSLVNRLLKQQVPHQVITDSLGHKSSQADKPYISMEEDMLRKCAIELPL